MAIPLTIQRYLQHRLVAHEILVHPATTTAAEAAESAYVPLAQLLRAVALRDRRGTLVAVFPADRRLDLNVLNQELKRELVPVADEALKQLFPDCETGLVPALSGAYGIKAIIESDDDGSEPVYFEASHSELIRMRRQDLVRVQHAWRTAQISAPVPSAPQRPSSADVRESMLERLRHLPELPPMPEMGQRIMQLRANPYARAQDLARVVELDPSLAAQVVGYARSPFFGYRGSVHSVQEAISRVLGYELGMNIVLGIALSQSFGSTGQYSDDVYPFWRHAVHCAALTQCLAKAMPQGHKPSAGLAYLTGLLHNFGTLLLLSLFEAEYYWLVKEAQNRPTESIIQIETDLLGITHMELGAKLLEHWNLPHEVVVTAREHHRAARYDDVHRVYPQLTCLANRLLKRLDIGDADSADVPPALMDMLSLTETQIEQVLLSIEASAENLNSVARQLAA